MDNECVKYKQVVKIVIALLFITVLFILVYFWLGTDRGNLSSIKNISQRGASKPETANNEIENQKTTVKSTTNNESQNQKVTTGDLSVHGNVRQEEVDLPLDPRAGIENVEAMIRVPVHPWQKERVANINSETIEQVIENVANFDDMHYAVTVRGDRGFQSGRMESEVSRVIHLSRVRRLLEEGRDNPRQIVPLLRAAYQDALAEYPIADALRKAYIKDLRSKGKNITYKEPDLFMKTQTQAVVATYLLAELEDHGSLHLLLDGYNIQHKWLEQKKHVSPVPPAMTLYAIHRLISTLPQDQLNSETLKMRMSFS